MRRRRIGLLLVCCGGSSDVSRAPVEPCRGPTVAMMCGVLGVPAPEGAIRRMDRAAPFPGGHLQTAQLGRALFGCSQPVGPVEAALASTDDLLAVFVGMFDNRDRVALDLEASGASLADRSPAGVLLEGFRRHGIELLRRMRGVFSGAVTDGSRLWLFRDQLGFWPLFYHWDDGQVAFATHARQVTAGAGLREEPDAEVVEMTFFRRLGKDMRTALKGVERIAPATLTTWSPSGAIDRPYWQPETLLEAGNVALAEVPGEFDELMTQAVARTLKGDDVVSLSGGIDSPAVAGYAAPISEAEHGRTLGAISVVYPQHPSVDESEFVLEVVDYLGMPYHLYEADLKPMDRFGEIMSALDGPLPISSLPERLHHLEKARALGFRNMLTGELAEYVMDMRDHVLSHLICEGRWGATAAHVRGLRSGGLGLRQTVRRTLAAITPARVLDLRRRWRQDPPVVPAPPSWLEVRRFPGPAAYPVRERWRADQLAAFGGPGMAFEAEFAIQAMSGVWTRLPWADIDLWEFFLGLRAETKYPDPWRKTLVRELIGGRVPDRVRYRTSRTFFDASMMEKIDYPGLRAWLVDPQFRLAGVDYAALKDELESESLTLPGFLWAKDLVSVHAFMSRWS